MISIYLCLFVIVSVAAAAILVDVVVVLVIFGGDVITRQNIHFLYNIKGDRNNDNNRKRSQ